MPTNVLYQQRRRVPRYNLLPSFTAKGATVTVFREEIETPLTGSILDISVGGLRARFARPSLPMLTRDEEIRVAVTMPKLLEFSGRSVVRHALYDSRRQHLTCGIELIEMHVTDRRRLEQLIESIRKTSARRQRSA
jgi:c-di-GMP-binding flagellar brake protein YcgR